MKLPTRIQRGMRALLACQQDGRRRDYARAMNEQQPEVETDDVIVLLLGAPGGPYERGFLPGITRLEKLVFLLERETPVARWLTETADFRSHRFGPFSAKVYRAVNVLRQAGMLEDSAARTDDTEERWEDINVVGLQDVDPYTERTFRLTDRGLKYYAALVQELGEREPEHALKAFKDRYAQLPLTQLVRYVYKVYPEFTDKSEIRDRVLGSS